MKRRSTRRPSKRGARELPKIERRPPVQLTPAQAERVRLMRERSLTLSMIADALVEDGISISRQAVSDQVTRGRWASVTKKRAGSRADLITEKFCTMTGTSYVQAWPDLLHEGEDESDPAVIDRINRARGRLTASDSSGQLAAAGD